MVNSARFTSLIVTYNSAGEISDILGDLRRLAPPHHIVVVDNASQDSTAEMVRSHFPEVALLVNPNNLGYAKAVNQGFELCETDFVFLLNPDIRVLDPRFYPAMLDCIQQSANIAAVGPLQFTQHGDTYRLNFTWSYWTREAFLIYLSHALNFRRKKREPVPTTFLNAGCLLLRKPAFNHVGKFNEKYFLYGEEPDLFLKFKLFRYECRLHAGVEVVHFRERSIKQLPIPERLFRKCQALYNIGDALTRGLVQLILAKVLGDRTDLGR